MCPFVPTTPDDTEITELFDNRGPVPANTYEVALVLGGTVSAGAYTAGVLDFLIEALDAWTRRRDAGDAVPRHKVVIRLITGTSGGGVNAAIAARALAYSFPPVTRATPDAVAAGNPFYDTWINQLTLDAMLQTEDLDGPNATPLSLLNGKAIDRAAAKLISFTGEPSPPRPYLADPLRLILTLTNLNGIPYRIDFGSVPLPDGSSVDLRQSYVDHADHARFAVVYPGRTLAAPRPDELVVAFDERRVGNAIRWETFGQFACGTAAFPIGFPPRRLVRPMAHYQYRIAAIPGAEDPRVVHWLPLVPDWEAVQDWADGIPDDYEFLVVDGGATDNEPIELARTALAGISGRNPRGGMNANRGVLLIDPFAGAAKMAAPLSLKLPDLAGALAGAMIQQTRYHTRDLLLAAYPDVYSRFMVSGLRGTISGDYALATAGLGAFIGFAHPAFRRHDYLLGRQNCQAFLRTQFVLPKQSPVFAGCLEDVKLEDYLFHDQTGDYLPIIPLVDDVRVPELLDPWPRNALDPSHYRRAIEDRFARLLQEELASGPLSSILTWIVGKLGEGKIADFVITAMQDALKDWKLV